MQRNDLLPAAKPLWMLMLMLLTSTMSYSQHTKKHTKTPKTTKQTSVDTVDVDVRAQGPIDGPSDWSKDDTIAALGEKITDLLDAGKNEEALTLLQTNREKLKTRYVVDYMVAQAEMGIAFKNKDYNKYLQLALAEERRDPRVYTVYFNVAAAYACIYASTGQDTARASALQYIARHKAAYSNQRDDAATDHINQVEYRLYTRDIIDEKTFHKKYPKGWERK